LWICKQLNTACPIPTILIMEFINELCLWWTQYLYKFKWSLKLKGIKLSLGPSSCCIPTSWKLLFYYRINSSLLQNKNKNNSISCRNPPKAVKTLQKLLKLTLYKPCEHKNWASWSSFKLFYYSYYEFFLDK